MRSDAAPRRRPHSGGGDGFAPREGVKESLIRRRARKERNRRITAGVLAIIVALVSFAALIRTFWTVERLADEPTPRDIFAGVHGWIVYGDWAADAGVWAMNPMRPGDPEDQVQLSERDGEPLAWSSDGSKLLIRRPVPDASGDPVADLDLFVLNADGTERRLTRDRDWITGSISPDGSQVIYVGGLAGNMYTVDTEGGEPRLLLARTRRWFPDAGRSFRTWLYNPTFSPDGTEIAYFDGMGDWGHSLRVMNADGSGVRVLVDQVEVNHIDNLAWSPDGSRLAFSAQEGGIWIVGVDGSGPRKVIPDGVNVYWSPDGSRISYQPADPLSFERGPLEIAAFDGMHIQEFGYGGSGPWNPLLLSEPGDREPSKPTSTDIFATVHGWIAWGNVRVKHGPPGIWAVDPTRPNDPEARIQLSDRPGKPLAWSSDGSSLLVWRLRYHRPSPCWSGLFVLNADGSETRLVTNTAERVESGCGVGSAGSFSPDGSQVVFATLPIGGVYTVDADGGTPRLVLASTREPRQCPCPGGGQERTLRTDLFAPAFSPDGTQIAYVDGMGDWGNTLRVMKADGTGVRVLVGDHAVDSYGCPWMGQLAWSPDGAHIAFTCGYPEDAKGIWVVGADGSGLTLVIPDGLNPHWSPDGSRIAFEIPWRRDIPLTQRGPLVVQRLAIANADGTHVQMFGYPALAGPWNPLPLSVPGKSKSTAKTASGLAALLVYAIALAVLVGVLIGGRRVRGKIAAKR